jgi:hypothetical protein
VKGSVLLVKFPTGKSLRKTLMFVSLREEAGHSCQALEMDIPISPGIEVTSTDSEISRSRSMFS